MKIDTHQHFWKYTPADYPWIGPGMEVLARDRMPANLAPLLAGMGVGGTVAVQARQCVAETEWLLSLAEAYPFILGVVGWVDLQSPEVEHQLERFGSHPKLVGVRHVVQDEPDDRFVLGEAFLRGMEKLANRHLAYDLLVYPRQLPACVELVRRFPEQVFVLDHIAKPFIRSGQRSPWDQDIARLATFKNVYCKLSGMVTEADWENWRPSDFEPYLDAVVEAFGPDRLMVGSDWPVCTLAGSYASVLTLVSDTIGRLTQAEQKTIWEDTPVRAYGAKLTMKAYE